MERILKTIIAMSATVLALCLILLALVVGYLYVKNN